MQRVVTLRALERRGKNQPHLHIYSDAVSSREEISWLVRHGVDGLVSTDVAVARATYGKSNCDVSLILVFLGPGFWDRVRKFLAIACELRK